MHYVYGLRGIPVPKKLYIGETNDLKRRLRQHSNGEPSHTARFAPWNFE